MTTHGFSRMDVRRPFALVRKSALQLAVQHMSYKACSAWCHARNIPKPTAFMDMHLYISVQSTASSWNRLCIDLFHIPAVWGKWHGPAIWSKPSHRPIYPSSVWLRWKSRTTISDRFNGLIKVFDEFTLSYLFIAQLFRILRLFKGHFRTWPNRPNSYCMSYKNNPSQGNAEGSHPFGVSVFNESIRYKDVQVWGMTHPKTYRPKPNERSSMV